MRNILFRGKTRHKNKWYFGSYLYLKDAPSYDWTGAEVGSRKDVHYIIDTNNINEAILPDTLSQWTWLTDKNDTKIFEGDCVQILDSGIIGVVRCGEYRQPCDDCCGGHIGFYVDWPKKEKYNLRKDLGYWNERIEVIGNIFDNSELVEGELT